MEGWVVLLMVVIFCVFPPLLVLCSRKRSHVKPAQTTPSHLQFTKRNLVDGRDWCFDKGQYENVYHTKYWRIHGKYYDLTPFIQQHPGGPDWLLFTQGTDCTEAFEVHHLNIDKVQQVLRKYVLPDGSGGGAEKKHNDTEEQVSDPSRFTFDKDGFYATLRERVRRRLDGSTGPTLQMKILTFVCVALWLASFGAVCYTASTWMAVLSGFLLMSVWGIGHNFFHQRDSPLRFLFNLTTCASDEWRITHAISHHLYPNTLLDIESTSIEPFVFFFSSSTKRWLYRTLVLFYVLPFTFIVLPVVFLKNLLLILLLLKPFKWEYFIALPELFVLYYSTGSCYQAVVLFFVMHASMSFVFVCTSWTVHHYDETWHDGDPYQLSASQGNDINNSSSKSSINSSNSSRSRSGRSNNDSNTTTASTTTRQERDFGRHIVLSTMDHTITENLFFNFIFFAGLNDHRLHHLFPTVDHSRFEEIRPEFVRTCKEFGLELKSINFFELSTGILRRLVQRGTVF